MTITAGYEKVWLTDPTRSPLVVLGKDKGIGLQLRAVERGECVVFMKSRVLLEERLLIFAINQLKTEFPATD